MSTPLSGDQRLGKVSETAGENARERQKTERPGLTTEAAGTGYRPDPMVARQALAAVQTIVEGMIVVDRDNRVTFMNPAAEKMTGWTLADALGLPSGMIFYIINSITREAEWQPVRPSMEDDRQYLLLPNSLLVTKDGREMPVEDTVSPMHDEEGTVVGAVILFRDVGTQRETLLRVLERVRRDSLTNLPNRSFFGDFLSTFKEPGNHFAILYLDLNCFKQINDTWGHLAGDFTLQVFAHRLKKTLSDDAVVCRWGGDEFVVLLRNIHSVGEVHAIVQRLHQAFEEVITWDVATFTASASIGFAMGNEAPRGDLLAIADEVMYKAKRASKMVPQRRTPCPAARKLQETPVVRLEEHALQLYFQPIYRLADGKAVGAEALLRRAGPGEEASLPEGFIAQAERSGSILPLGRAILREAICTLDSWRRDGLAGMSLAVNVSATELLDPEYLVHLDRLLAEETYAGEGLILEVTESVLLLPDAERNIVAELKKRRLQVAIDDFGMGYSNLSQLRRSPFDIIKIDRDFLKQVTESTQDSKLVTAIVEMAHSLERSVVAEGVETPAQRTFLTEIGCDQAQGFLFSRALPADEIADLFQRA